MSRPKCKEGFRDRSEHSGGRKKVSWFHSDEGERDMPSDVKVSLFGVSRSITISAGQFPLDLCQGVLFCDDLTIRIKERS